MKQIGGRREEGDAGQKETFFFFLGGRRRRRRRGERSWKEGKGGRKTPSFSQLLDGNLENDLWVFLLILMFFSYRIGTFLVKILWEIENVVCNDVFFCSHVLKYLSLNFGRSFKENRIMLHRIS